VNADVPNATLLSEPFAGSHIVLLRRAVAQVAAAAGLDKRRQDDLVLALDELLTNAVRHGGGTGRLDVWVAQGQLWFQVSDTGPGMAAPAPAQLPPTTTLGGRGLWIARSLTDQFDISSSAAGTTVQGAVRIAATS
jgi:anti-sigma regulatory factor (Ser/Thr protein kinase)